MYDPEILFGKDKVREAGKIMAHIQSFMFADRTKVCKVCGKEKPIFDFPIAKRNIDGRMGTCCECHREKRRIYRKNKKERDNMQNKEMEKVAETLATKSATEPTVLGHDDEGFGRLKVKMCKHCGRTLPLTAFGDSKTSKDKHRGVCKKCTSEINRSYYLKRKEQKAKTDTEVKADVEIHNETDTDNKTKVCTCCGRRLPLDQFYKYKKSPDGHETQCRECREKKRKMAVKNKNKSNMNKNRKSKVPAKNVVPNDKMVAKAGGDGIVVIAPELLKGNKSMLTVKPINTVFYQLLNNVITAWVVSSVNISLSEKNGVRVKYECNSYGGMFNTVIEADEIGNKVFNSTSELFENLCKNSTIPESDETKQEANRNTFAGGGIVVMPGITPMTVQEGSE